jgi:hypothetical protein
MAQPTLVKLVTIGTSRTVSIRSAAFTGSSLRRVAAERC